MCHEKRLHNISVVVPAVEKKYTKNSPLSKNLQYSPDLHITINEMFPALKSDRP